jgi:hypothetical protein
MQRTELATFAGAGEEESAIGSEAREMAGFRHPGGSAGLPGNRLDLDSSKVQHDLARFVLGLIEVIRQLIERQALRRVEGGHLTAEQIERLGLTLMRLEERMEELKEHFGVAGEELRLDLSGIVEDF